MKQKFLIPLIIAGLVILMLVTSCEREKKRDLSSLPDEVRPIAEAIIDDSPEKFASAVSYPVERPYPLRNINDSAEMVRYYPTLVDSKLRNAVAEAPDSVWSQDGWRGWTLGNGSYFYIDSGKIYSLDYVSEQENEMLDSLRHEEISTLDPSMQDGWTPVLCVVDPASYAVFRIDSHGTVDNPIFRLSAYADTTDLSSQPNWMLYGHLNYEGSMGTRLYEFSDSLGETTAYYSPDITEDDEIPYIEVDHNGRTRKYKARPEYWLDQVKVRQSERNVMDSKRNDDTKLESSKMKSIKVRHREDSAEFVGDSILEPLH